MQYNQIIYQSIKEDGNKFDIDNPNEVFFTEVEDLKFQNIEWKQIENTYLGRRLNTNFNTLRNDKRILQSQLKEILANKEKEIKELSDRLKKDAFA